MITEVFAPSLSGTIAKIRYHLHQVTQYMLPAALRCEGSLITSVNSSGLIWIRKEIMA